MPAPLKRRYIYSDVLEWDEGDRVELIEGGGLYAATTFP